MEGDEAYPDTDDEISGPSSTYLPPRPCPATQILMSLMCPGTLAGGILPKWSKLVSYHDLPRCIQYGKTVNHIDGGRFFEVGRWKSLLEVFGCLMSTVDFPSQVWPARSVRCWTWWQRFRLFLCCRQPVPPRLVPLWVPLWSPGRTTDGVFGWGQMGWTWMNYVNKIHYIINMIQYESILNWNCWDKNRW